MHVLKYFLINMETSSLSCCLACANRKIYFKIKLLADLDTSRGLYPRAGITESFQQCGVNCQMAHLWVVPDSDWQQRICCLQSISTTKMELARPLAVAMKCLSNDTKSKVDVLGGFLFRILLKEVVTCAKWNSFGRSDGVHARLAHPIDSKFEPPYLLAILRGDLPLGTGMSCTQTLHRYLNSWVLKLKENIFFFLLPCLLSFLFVCIFFVFCNKTHSEQL